MTVLLSLFTKATLHKLNQSIKPFIASHRYITYINVCISCNKSYRTIVIHEMLVKMQEELA